jgi:urea transport system substrate-binding protein
MSQQQNPVQVTGDFNKVIVPHSTLPGGQPLSGQTISGADNPDLRKILSPSVLGTELGWLGHYKVLKILGQGGMGMVFQAEDTRLQRLVAIKVMLPELAGHSSTRERFLREARAIAILRNDHVVTIYEVNQENDVPYLAMEFLQGQSLDDRLSTGQPFTLAEILRITREIASGLAAAHEAGLIHRDIKPANIWLEGQGVGGRRQSAGSSGQEAGDRSQGAEGSAAKSTSDPLPTASCPLPPGDCPLPPADCPTPPRVKILDFGLVRPQTAAPGQLTQTGKIVGTPHYMAPEQARGQAVDARTDLFSLGVVLYHLCTKELPFKGDSLMALLTSLAVDTPRPVSELNPKLPTALVDLVARLLEKDPQRRPASARAVIEIVRALENKLSYPTQPFLQPDAPVPAAPSSTLSPRTSFSRRGLVGGLLGLVVLVAALTPWLRSHFFASSLPLAGEPVRIGVLHSSTGTMAISERPVIDAILLAIHEVNEEGGILGRPLEPIIEDGESDETIFAQKAEKLIHKDQVVTVFGCWTSASRKAVKPVVEKYNHLLIYPVSYEGMELSPNIIYAGAVPNQQILPALQWCSGFLYRKRWFLVGSDYVFPHAANEVIKDEAKKIGSQIVGEQYIPLGSSDVNRTIQAIVQAQPDLILNTLNGDSNVAFFRALRKAGIQSETIPTLSFSISEAEMSSLKITMYAGDYTAGNYQEDSPLPQNQRFVKAFKDRYGSDRRISDAMQTAYYSLHLWSQAARQASALSPLAIRTALKGQSFDAPQGKVQIDSATQPPAPLTPGTPTSKTSSNPGTNTGPTPANTSHWPSALRLS